MANVDNFRKVPVQIPYKSGFDKSFRNTMTGTTGTLIPVLVDELIPNTDVFCRVPFVLGMPPLAADTFMNLHYNLEAFFVPTRLLMKGYEKWLNGESNIRYSGDGFDYKIRTPLLEVSQQETPFGAGSLLDYLGFKSNLIANETAYVTALPALAYHLIYEEFYRASLVQRSIFADDVANAYSVSHSNMVIPSDNGSVGYIIRFDENDAYADGVGIFDLRQRNFGADYFTVSTPSPQNGRAIGVGLSLLSQNFMDMFDDAFRSGYTQSGDIDWNDVPDTLQDGAIKDNGVIGNDVTRGKSDNFTVRSGNTQNQSRSDKFGGFTIASLRAANSLQQFLERNNIAGNRFVDFLRANYGAELSDGVAQRPVYLGSSSIPVYVNGVLQTAPANNGSTNNPFDSVGANYGRAIAQDKDFVVKFHCDEPGYLFVIGSLVPEVTYSSGINRLLCRYVREDSRTEMANHLLQNVGPQPIFNYEVEANVDSSDFTNVFGYVDRYADFMTRNNELHGLLRDGESLEAFALQRQIAVEDGISSSVLRIPKGYLNQVMAVTDANAGYSYWIDFYFEYKVSMPLARYSVPSLQDPAYEHGDTIWLNRGGVRID